MRQGRSGRTGWGAVRTASPVTHLSSCCRAPGLTIAARLRSWWPGPGWASERATWVGFLLCSGAHGEHSLTCSLQQLRHEAGWGSGSSQKCETRPHSQPTQRLAVPANASGLNDWVPNDGWSMVLPVLSPREFRKLFCVQISLLTALKRALTKKMVVSWHTKTPSVKLKSLLAAWFQHRTGARSSHLICSGSQNIKVNNWDRLSL